MISMKEWSSRSLTVLALVSFFTISQLSACHHNQEENPKTQLSSAENNQQLHIVKLDHLTGSLSQILTSSAQMVNLPFSIEATGQLQVNANAVTRITAPVPGKVTTIFASVGEFVKAGQAMASITSQEVSSLISELFKFENELESDLSKELLEIEYLKEQERAEATLSEKQYERTKLLVEEKISSTADLEKARTQLEKHSLTMAALERKTARTKEVAEEKKRLARASLEQRLTLLGVAKDAIDKSIKERNLLNAIDIRAPQSGFVLERNINTGELVDSTRTLFVVDDIDSLWLIADIFEQDVQQIEKGQQVEFVVDSFPSEHFHGSLDFVAGTINPETRTLSIRAIIPNPKLRLKPKMFARITIKTGTRKVLAIPKSAIQDAGSKKVVYVEVANKTFEQRDVLLGEESSSHVQVLGGLREGEKVVTSGSFSLRSEFLKQSR